MPKNQRIIELLGMITRRLARQLSPIAETENLSLTEVLVLWKMNRKKVSRVNEIAEEIGASPSTFTGVLDRLVAAGWLTREPDPEDRRAVLVRSTPSVGKALARLMEKSNTHLAKLFRPLPKELPTRLVHDLETLLECLDSEGSSK